MSTPIELTPEESAVLQVIRTAPDRIRDSQIREKVHVVDPDVIKKGAGLRRVIHSLREKGFPICSDWQGYWYSEDKDEILENANAMRGRAYKILDAARGMEETAERYESKTRTI